MILLPAACAEPARVESEFDGDEVAVAPGDSIRWIGAVAAVGLDRTPVEVAAFGYVGVYDGASVARLGIDGGTEDTAPIVVPTSLDAVIGLELDCSRGECLGEVCLTLQNLGAERIGVVLDVVASGWSRSDDPSLTLELSREE